jgi:hypothetical protein
LDYLASEEVGVVRVDSDGNYVLNEEAAENGVLNLNGAAFDGLEEFFLNKFLITDERVLHRLIGDAVATQEG